LSNFLWLRQLRLDHVRQTIQAGMDQLDRGESISSLCGDEEKNREGSQDQAMSGFLIAARPNSHLTRPLIAAVKPRKPRP